jgi:hypothetical protein
MQMETETQTGGMQLIIVRAIVRNFFNFLG